jgi:glycosyltransferase involved in cell wall biosynthesis
VCFLIDSLLAGGTEMQLLSLIRHLDRDAVQPYLCLLDGEDPVSRSLEPVDCPVVRLGLHSLASLEGMRRAWQFARFLRRERIDVLQVYFVDSAIFGAVVGRLAGVRRILRVRNNIGHWVDPIRVKRFRVVNWLVTAILTNSRAGREAVIAQEGADPRMVLLVENGIDLARFPDAPDPGRFGRAPTKRVGIVANRTRVKGLDVLIDAAAEVLALEPAAVFSIAGGADGQDLLPELREQVSRLGLDDRVEFLGRVTDIPAFLATLEVGVLSSRAEGTSNALIEYMAAGLPIVATTVGGNVDLIRDGVDGILVPPEDPERLAAAVLRLLRDPSESARLAQAAHQSVRARFGIDAFARSYERAYLGHGGDAWE